ncbi:adenylate cyclase [Skermanella stibiiresistens SB22]|uniref:Adenylate cyclase n=1 Tax=Skermanella stibiiresistens SB22 TaxID=1385369 RepID=W9H6K1_9PROT|nr:adenylate cyclase [Skermanella stibiiresistens SB22]
MIDWLMEDGRSAAGISALMDAFCDRLIQGGVPLYRAAWQVRMLHPQIRGISFNWRRGRDQVEEIEREHGTELRPEYLNSPIGAIIEGGADAMRYRIEQLEPPYPYAILEDIKAQGGTDYVAMPMRFSTGRLNVATWASNKPGGFSADQLTLIYDVMPALSTVLETMALRRLAVNVLDTYVGREAGSRILSGDIRRGTGETLRAVLWYCDLRGFTSLADRLPLADLIGLLNGYFEIMAGVVQARGGEILKFIGDAMLAIFPLPDGVEPDAKVHDALDAALEAVGQMETRNRELQAWGLPTLKAGIAMHVGDVMYGNIGAPDRLDFTVIGPAVNLVSRIEGLCAELGRPILTSEAFAAVCPPRLTSLGHHPVKGLREQIQVFGPTAMALSEAANLETAGSGAPG